MAPNAGSQSFVGLADVDRLSVVVEEGVDAPAIVSDWQSAGVLLGKRRIEELRQVFPQILGLERREVDRVGVAAKEASLLRLDGSASFLTLARCERYGG
jgi:hypothetical protein